MIDWISVKERLPKYDEPVLMVWASGESVRDKIWYDRDSFKWMEDGAMDFWGPCRRNVTHWLPYPNPPKPDTLTSVLD